MIITVYACPPSPNELRRKYKDWRAYKKLRAAWEHDLYYGVDGAHRREQWKRVVQGNVKIELSATLYHKKLYDPDNLVGAMKPVIDAMVNIGYLKGDSAEQIEIKQIDQVISNDLKTIIRLNAFPLNSQADPGNPQKT